MSNLSSSYCARCMQFTVKKGTDPLNLLSHLNNLDYFLFFSRQFRQKRRTLLLQRMVNNCTYESMTHFILPFSFIERSYWSL